MPHIDFGDLGYAAQQPSWPDSDRLAAAVTRLESAPPLVFAGEVDKLRDRLAEVARGEATLLQGGDCAETFDGNTAPQIRAKLRTLLQMAIILTHNGRKPVVRVGRLAGQYAKPRSSETETRDGVTLPAYRGDAVNGHAFTAESREPNPDRLIQAYYNSAITLNLIKSFTDGGFADLSQMRSWNDGFDTTGEASERYTKLASSIEQSIDFFHAWGVPDSGPAALAKEFYSSHEALLLDYERALVRSDSRTPEGRPYSVSGHLLWIGERTRGYTDAHVNLLARLHNPVAVKLGPMTVPRMVTDLADRLDPDRIPGRLTFVSRMGADRVRDVLPSLVEGMERRGHRVGWVCDPMHGNTISVEGVKTRRYEDVLDEVRGFYEVFEKGGYRHAAAGGLHMEMTGDDVTECLGGACRVEDLNLRYESLCDPRLNHEQSIELAFEVAELIRTTRGES